VHKKIYLFSLLSSAIQRAKLTDIRYKEYKIKQILYSKEKFYIDSDKLYLIGKIKAYKNYGLFHFQKASFNNYTLTDINGKIKFANIIKLKSDFFYNKKPLSLQASLKNDTLFANIYIPKNTLSIKNRQFNIKNLKITLKYNLKDKIPFVTLNASLITTKEATIKDLYLKYINDILYFYAKKASIPALGDIKNAILTNIKGSYDIKENFLTLKTKKFDFDYFNYKLLLSDNEAVFLSPDNFDITSKKAQILFDSPIDKIKITTHNFIFEKLNDFTYIKTANTALKNIFLTLYSDLIEGNLEILKSKKISGHYKNLPLEFKNTTYSIPKFLLNTHANINNIPLKAKVYIKQKRLIAKSKLKVNSNLKKILQTFNINIPVNQLKGNILLDINATPNDIFAVFESNSSVYEYNDSLFSYENLKGLYKHKELNSTVKELKIASSFFNSVMDSKIYVNPNYLNIFANVKKFTLHKILDIKNFHEKISMDFKNKIIYLLNAFSVIDLNQNIIKIITSKHILKYSPLKRLINDISATIYLKNPLIIQSEMSLIYPLLLNTKEPKKINLTIIADKNITVHNSFFDLNITDTNLNASIQNATIDLKTVFKAIDVLEPIFESNSTSSSNPFSSYIKSNQTNYVYENKTFLSDKASLKITNNIYIKSTHKQSSLNGYTKRGYFLLEGTNYQKEELIPLLSFFKSFEKIKLDFVLVKSPDNFYTGKVYIDKGVVKELTTLNNIIAFINTIPSLLSLKNPGFSAKGYKIKKGYIDYLLYKDILYFKKIEIKGINLDFDAKGYIDLNKNQINLKITAKLKMRLKNIPIIGKGISYILFGKDGNIDVKLVVKGNADNPKVSQDIGKDILLTPFELFKRIITLPFNLF